MVWRTKLPKRIMALLSGTFFVLVIGFTNCQSGDSDYQLFQASQCSSEDTSCQLDTEELDLDLRIHGEFTIPVPAGVVGSGLVLSGDCNEGDYSNNKITWKLFYQNTLLSDSQDLGLNSTCVNGRFEIRVSLYTLSKVAGTLTPTLMFAPGSARVNQTLEVEIIGIDSKGQEHQNSNIARKKVSLVPS